MSLKRIEVKINRELDIKRHHDYKELGNLFGLLDLESYTRMIYDWGVHQGQELNKYIIRDYDSWYMRGKDHMKELMGYKSDNIQPVKDRLRKLTKENIMLKQVLEEVQTRMNIKVDIKEL